MKIGIDLDEVLADTLSAFVRYHNGVYGTVFKRDDFSSYRFSEVIGGTEAGVYREFEDFCRSPFNGHLQPVMGAQKAVQQLSRLHELILVTSRSASVEKETAAWIHRYFPHHFSEIYFTNHYLPEKKTTKASVCEAQRIDVLIEDQLKYALECSSLKRKILLLDYPWNRSTNLPANIYRVRSWEEILKCSVFKKYNSVKSIHYV